MGRGRGPQERGGAAGLPEMAGSWSGRVEFWLRVGLGFLGFLGFILFSSFLLFQTNSNQMNSNLNLNSLKHSNN